MRHQKDWVRAVLLGLGCSVAWLTVVSLIFGIGDVPRLVKGLIGNTIMFTMLFRFLGSALASQKVWPVARLLISIIIAGWALRFLLSYF